MRWEYFKINRKFYYIILTILIVLVASLSVAYAVLSTVLNISGSTEIVASSWDIHFDNIEVDSGSVNSDKPEIVGNNISFSSDLKKPGDYYRFTVDVVNDGSIDAMIDSVVKSPELTANQAKYIKYDIEYEDGSPISSRHILARNDDVTLSVTVAFRNDISVSDLPSSDVDLNLGFTLIYIQADDSSVEVPSITDYKIEFYNYFVDSESERHVLAGGNMTFMDLTTLETKNCNLAPDKDYCYLREFYDNRTYSLKVEELNKYKITDILLSDQDGIMHNVIDSNGNMVIPKNFSTRDYVLGKIYYDISNYKKYHMTIYVRKSSDSSIVAIENSSVSIRNILFDDVTTEVGEVNTDGNYVYEFGDIISNMPYEINIDLGDQSFTIDAIKAKNTDGEYVDISYNGESNKFLLPIDIKDNSKYLNTRVYITLN